MGHLFYRPEDAFTADVIPYWEDGVFHLFYLKEYRGENRKEYGEGIAWHKITTKDFVHFEDRGEMIPRGTIEEQDICIFTGSIIKAENVYHIFYTGFNWTFGEKGKPQQAVMHAVSHDSEQWTKIPEHTFFADSEKYEPHDFRDPFVFWNEETNRYEMLLVSRKKDSGHTSGFTARYASNDLVTWTDEGDFWAPALFHTHECPDLFKMGDWWYMIYSEYSDKNITRYIMSKSINGPWVMPVDDAFDGRAYYAAKSVCDNEKRYLFGWLPTKINNIDWEGWMWGGNLVVHEIYPREDGTLACRMPESLKKTWKAVSTHEDVTAANTSGKSDVLLFPETGSTYRLDAVLEYAEGARSFGLEVGYNHNEKKGYKFEFFPGEKLFKWDSVAQMINSKDVTRPFTTGANQSILISIIKNEDMCVMYVNDEYALSTRMYDIAGRDISFFAVGGSAQIKNAELFERL